MKTIIKTCLLILVLSGVMSMRIRKDLPMTPKAVDLMDHYGTEPAKNLYGPKLMFVGNLAREGFTGEGTPISPINNFSKEINPIQVVAGELDNTSYDASKIIKAEIAGKNIQIY